MFKFIFRVLVGLYNQAGMAATLSGCSIMTVLAAVSGYLAKHTIWISSYGPIGWWIAVLMGACVGMALLLAFARLRYHLATASAMNKWKERTNKINPLASEFRRERVFVSDLVPPFMSVVEGKTFIECEIIGPAIIAIYASSPGSTSVTGNDIYDTAGVIVKDNVFVPTGIMFKDCHFLRCKIARLLTRRANT